MEFLISKSDKNSSLRKVTSWPAGDLTRQVAGLFAKNNTPPEIIKISTGGVLHQGFKAFKPG
jgi:hypothetical protein